MSAPSPRRPVAAATLFELGPATVDEFPESPKVLVRLDTDVAEQGHVNEHFFAIDERFHDLGLAYANIGGKMLLRDPSQQHV